MHGTGARRAVLAVQPPGGVRGVRLGHRSGVDAVPDVPGADRPELECGGRGGGVVGGVEIAERFERGEVSRGMENDEGRKEPAVGGR